MNETLLNVTFGILIAYPIGWFFMAIIVILECLAMSKLLARKWYDKKAYLTAIVSNAISGIFGIVISIFVIGGVWMIVWLPWVSSGEVNLSKTDMLQVFLFMYTGAFIVTLIIEGLVNILILKKTYDWKPVLKATLMSNILSYVIGSAIMYSISFGLIS